MKIIIFRILFILSMFFSLSSCKTIDVRGQFISDDQIKEINVKKPTKNEVREMLGTPTYIPDYQQDTWYYVQRSMTRRAWFDPKVDTQRIVEIKFNKTDKVISIMLHEDTQNEGLSVHSDYTKTKGTEKNSIQKFVKNIGRFNKSTDGAKRKNKRK